MRLNKQCYQRCPAGLMGRSKTTPVFTMKILMEEKEVCGRLFLLQGFVSSHGWANPVLVFQKELNNATGKPLRDFPQREVILRAYRIFNAKFGPIVSVEFVQRLDYQIVDGHPHRSTPV